MTSYNFLNGIETSENKDLLTNITRGEWGYEGIFMTDWGNSSNHAREVLAGNDVKMPSGSPATLKAALKKGILKRSDLEDCAERLVKMIMKVNIFKEKILNPVTVDIGDDTYFKAAENILWSQTARGENTSDEDGGKDLGYCDAGHGHSIRSTLPRAELTACLHVLHPMQAAEHLIFWQTAQRLQVSRQSTPADGRNGPHWKHSRSNWKQEFIHSVSSSQRAVPT